MARRGYSSVDVLSGTGLSEADLRQPGCLVEIPHHIRIIHNIYRLSESPALAFSLADELTLGDLGILGYSVMTCEDTDEATKLWHQYNPVFFGNLIETSFKQVGDQLLLTCIPYPDIRENLLQFLIEEKLCYDLALQRLIGLSEFPLAKLTLSYAEPAHTVEYFQRLQCPIEFSANQNSLLLQPNAMTLPLQGGDVETHQCCLLQLERSIEQIDANSTLAQQITSELFASAPSLPGVEDVAANLRYTSRTLHRRLREEGVSFSGLSTATRLQIIKNLLATTDLKSVEIAGRVGFSDVRSLRRFFKQHTGHTLRQFRLNTAV